MPLFPLRNRFSHKSIIILITSDSFVCTNVADNTTPHIVDNNEVESKY